MNQIIECVPNFSEGNDLNIIKQITDEIESVEGVRLLNVDPGKATNRTVVTFAGSPAEVVEAAFRAIKKASELIDMQKHKGEHPRFGATDVCPLVPVSNITMDETVVFARKLAERIGNELDIPVYCYENAAFDNQRRNLAWCRSGEYEGLSEKITRNQWKPDFGRPVFNARSGAIAVGARDFLIAYNINLNTTSVRRANSIAFDIREKGRVKRKGDPVIGEIVKDKEGNPLMIPGSLKSVKGIGWYIEEFGIAQVSLNLTNTNVTPLHKAYDEAFKKAEERGLRVTGSEIVGLVPLKAMTEAGKYFLRKQKRSVGVSESELIRIAVISMGLNELYKFEPKEKIIEYILADKKQNRLTELTLTQFADVTASELPAPGGGSVSAVMGLLGAALGTMVANLSSHKRGWDSRWEEFSVWAEKGRDIHDRLLHFVDEDTLAFNAIMEAFSLPKTSAAEKQLRSEAIQLATVNAARVPLKIMETAFTAFDLLSTMIEEGNPASVTDAGVGLLAIRSSILGAGLNVKINAADIEDKSLSSSLVKRATELSEAAIRKEKELLQRLSLRIAQK